MPNEAGNESKTIYAVAGVALSSAGLLGLAFGVLAVLESGGTMFSKLNFIGGVVIACLGAYLLVPGTLSLLAWRRVLSPLWALLAIAPLALPALFLLAAGFAAFR